MAGIKRFEDIDAWKDARELVREVYDVTREGAFSRDFGLRDQIRRAAVSVMSNIAEGFERGSDKEFRQFLHVAKASAGECRSLLIVATDVGYLEADRRDELVSRATEVSRKIGGFIRYLNRGIKRTKDT